LKQKPRNPFVALAKFRSAGQHGKTEKAKRRAETSALKQALKHIAGIKDGGSLLGGFAVAA
jgi:hypothetical protein